MASNQYWQMFKKTGSVEAYLTYSSLKSLSENNNVQHDKNNGTDTKNNRYPEQR